MFGYISCDEDKLQFSDKDIIGAFYCGLCMALKKNFGNTARFFTNLDCTYAYMLIASALNDTIDLQKNRCILHPMSKRNIAYVDNQLSKKICSATILISYYKLLDDCKDEKNNITKKSLRSLFKKNAIKAKSILPNFDNILKLLLNETQSLESEQKDNLEQLMNISGQILEAFANECGASDLRKLFFDLGRFVYFIDAVDDYAQDLKKHRYNAIAYKFGDFTTKEKLVLNRHKELDEIFNEIKQNIQNEYQSLQASESNTIFDNLFNLGLQKTYDNVKKRP